MDKKHNYYILEQKKKTFWAPLFYYLSLPLKIPSITVSFFLARDLTHIALNPGSISDQRPINLIKLSDDPQEDIILVNFKKKKKFSWLSDVISLIPFLSTASHGTIQHNHLEDMEHVNQLLDEVDKLINGLSGQKNCTQRCFDWSHIHFKGMEFLDAKMRTYIYEHLDQKYKGATYQINRLLNMEFYTLKTAENIELDSVALLGAGEEEKPMSERTFVITCIDRDQNYINWIKDLNYTAQKLGATAISFNYRGVDFSLGYVRTEQNMVDDVLAQVNRLIALGAQPEHICLDGVGLSGAIATLAAAQAHREGLKVKINNERSFRSLPLLLFGFLAPQLHEVNWWSPLTYLRFAAASIAYLIFTPILWLAGWRADAGSAWDSIPVKDKIFSVVRDKESNTYDGVINDSFSSIASLIDTRLHALTEKIRHKKSLTHEEIAFLIEYDEQQHFKPTETVSASEYYSCAHFVSRKDLVAEQAHQAPYTNHDFFLNKLKDKLTIDKLLEEKKGHRKQIRPEAAIPQALEEKPLILASSGGGGHISAAKGIMNELQAKNPNLILTDHRAKLYDTRSFTLMSGLMRIALWLGSLPVIGSLINKGGAWFGSPAVPGYSAFWEQMAKTQQAERLADADAEKGRLRPYVDMLLDVCPAGYESAAWYNATYLTLTPKDISAMTAFQKVAEGSNYSAVFQKILHALIVAAKEKTPYTEIISTQALSINAICDAVLYYNNSFLPQFNKKHKLANPPISIAQYLTDLPTIGCNHFMNALEGLSLEQRQVLEINAVCMSEPIKAAYFGAGHGYKAVHNIEPRSNPMVRSGFKAASLKNYTDSSKAYALNYQAYWRNPETGLLRACGQETITIKPQSKIASIMLGSLATSASADYVTHLLEQGYDQVFVFGGLNSEISKRIDKIVASYPLDQQQQINKKIIRLGNQSDVEMAPIFTRSNCVVIRGGGLSVMEQMAMPVMNGKVVLMHHEDSPNGVLTSGLSWEDSNANRLISYMSEQKAFAIKTSPERCSGALKAAEQYYDSFEPSSKDNSERFSLKLKNEVEKKFLPSERSGFFYHKPEVQVEESECSNDTKNSFLSRDPTFNIP